MDVDQGDFLSPEPSPEMIIKAEKVSKYTSSCSLINGILEIKVIDNTTNVVYIKHIDNSSPFWIEDGKFFQNNIKKLYDILTMCFNGTYQDITLASGIDWSFEIASNDIMESVNNALSNDEVLKVDYNYENFKQTFEEEMNKMKSGN